MGRCVCSTDCPTLEAKGLPPNLTQKHFSRGRRQDTRLDGVAALIRDADAVGKYVDGLVSLPAGLIEAASGFHGDALAHSAAAASSQVQLLYERPQCNQAAVEKRRLLRHRRVFLAPKFVCYAAP